MKRGLSSTLSLIRRQQFPCDFLQNRKRYEVTVGIGGNVGDVVRRFEHLLFVLQKDIKLSLHQSSPVLKNPPFGFTNQKDFYNAVLVLSTDMRPRAFLKHLLSIEQKFGRKRSFKNAPRTLDIDMIFFDQEIMKHKDLTLPHPAWSQRESVLIPLAYLGKHH